MAVRLMAVREITGGTRRTCPTLGPGYPPREPELSDQPHGTTAAATSATAASPADPRADGGALAARYGRTPGSRRRAKALAIAAAAAIVVVFGAWALWAGPGQDDHGLDNDVVGYQVLSEHSTVVHSTISVDPGTRASCAVQALDKSYAIVGWKVITLPVSDERTRSVSTEVATTTRAVTGLIHSCWVP